MATIFFTVNLKNVVGAIIYNRSTILKQKLLCVAATPKIVKNINLGHRYKSVAMATKIERQTKCASDNRPGKYAIRILENKEIVIF